MLMVHQRSFRVMATEDILSVWRGRIGSSVLSLVIVIGLAMGAVAGSACNQPPQSSGSESLESRRSGPRPEADETLGDFEIFVRVIDFAGTYTLLGNGFPVERLPVYTRMRGRRLAGRLTTTLIGEGNVAGIQVTPYLQAYGERLQVGPVELRAWVQRDEGDVKLPGTEVSRAAVDTVVAAWRERAEAQWEALRAEGRGLSSLGAWAAQHPIVIETPRFDNGVGPDFSGVFEEAPVMAGTAADSARLRDYAMQLRDWMAAKDTLAIYHAYRRSFDVSGRDRASAIDIIATDWFSVDWNTQFSRKAVGLRAWSGGRVWELYRRDDQRKPALFLAGENRLVSWHEAYVAEIDGDLQVVR